MIADRWMLTPGFCPYTRHPTPYSLSVDLAQQDGLGSLGNWLMGEDRGYRAVHGLGAIEVDVFQPISQSRPLTADR